MNLKMRRNYSLLFFALLAISIVTLSACNHMSLEDRAEKDAKNFTERYCPTPVQNMQRTDSVVFDRSNHTFIYYYRLNGAADNAQAVAKVRDKIRNALLTDLKNNTATKVYKDQGYNFRYVLRSEKTKEILYEVELTPKNYK